MQALYSQPHKMMEIRPGVALNEGGKTYGGENYNISRPHQKDLTSYKKQKEQNGTDAEKKTAEMLKKKKQMELEEQNSRLNKFCHSISNSTNIFIENQVLVMEKPGTDKREEVHPHPHYYPIYGSPSYIEKRGTTASEKKDFKIRKASQLSVKRNMLSERSK